MRSSNRAFTLIELLVVIAIIGILSAVVLAALNSARSKGNDAAIKANLKTVLNQAALYYDNVSPGGFSTGVTVTAVPSSFPNSGTAAACASTQTGTIFADSNISKAIAIADKDSGGAGGTTPTNVRCSVGAATAASPLATWSVYVPLTNNTGSNTGWCIDSIGAAKADTAPSAAITCP